MAKERKSMYGVDDAETLKKLKKGDKLYTCEYEYNAQENKGAVIINEYEFIEFKKDHERNHIGLKLDEHDQFATVKDVRYPDVDIPNTDLSTGYHTTKKAAVLCFFESIEMIYNSLKKIIEENDWN